MKDKKIKNWNNYKLLLNIEKFLSLLLLVPKWKCFNYFGYIIVIKQTEPWKQLIYALSYVPDLLIVYVNQFLLHIDSTYWLLSLYYSVATNMFVTTM